MIDATPQPVYGGSLRVTARTAGSGRGATVSRELEREAAGAIDRPAGLSVLGDAVETARREVPAHLREAHGSGRRVVGYGAPARSITFLNALGVGPELLPYTVDRAAAKHGRMIPGVRIPILEPAALAAEPPDEILVLAWDLAPEIRASLAIPELSGTRFLVAVPRLADVAASEPGGERPAEGDVVR